MKRVVWFLLSPFISLLEEFLKRNIVVIGIGREEFIGVLRESQTQKPAKSETVALPKNEAVEIQHIVDTSVLIDGRIMSIMESGFLQGVLIIPDCVLREIRVLAGSFESLRRNRGRIGSATVNNLIKNFPDAVHVLDPIEQPNPDVEVDDQLLSLARTLKASLLTIDFNLGEMAKAQGIEILNINALAVALRPTFLPGDLLTLEIKHEGKELGQGVGYLEDGTMVIVEKARKLVGTIVKVQVARNTQSQTGVMVFANLVSF